MVTEFALPLTVTPKPGQPYRLPKDRDGLYWKVVLAVAPQFSGR